MKQALVTSFKLTYISHKIQQNTVSQTFFCISHSPDNFILTEQLWHNHKL